MRFLKFPFWGLTFFLVAQSGFSQSNTEWVWRPEYSYSSNPSNRLAYIAKISLYNSVNHLENRSAVLNIQPQVLLKYRLISLFKIGGGYLYRRSTPFMSQPYHEFRTMQEWGSGTNSGSQRIAHRLQAEQRFRSTSYLNRIRYRIRYNFPLEDNILNPGDHYLIFSNELMSVFNKNEANAENRLATGMGWFYNRHRKFELTLEYRTRDILNRNGVIHLFMMKTSFYTNR